MATIHAVRDAIAEHIGAAIDATYRSGRQPSPLFPMTVFVKPTTGADYVTFDQTAWDQPVIALSVIVCGPAANLDVSYRWLDAAIFLAAQACQDAGDLDGMVSGLLLNRVAEPGWVTVEGTSPVLSAELILAPFYLRPGG